MLVCQVAELEKPPTDRRKILGCSRRFQLCARMGSSIIQSVTSPLTDPSVRLDALGSSNGPHRRWLRGTKTDDTRAQQRMTLDKAPKHRPSHGTSTGPPIEPKSPNPKGRLIELLKTPAALNDLALSVVKILPSVILKTSASATTRDFGAESLWPTISLSTLLPRRSPGERQDSLPIYPLRL